MDGTNFQLTVKDFKDVLNVPELPCPLSSGAKLGWLCQRQWNSADTELLRTNEVLLSLKDSQMIRARICICLEIKVGSSL